MLNILICDDNKEEFNLITSFITQYENTKQKVSFHTHCFSSSKAALDYINISSIDIAILDIEIDDKTGIEIAKILKEKNYKTLIIFVTNYDSYAYSAYNVEALDYLLKPISYDKFSKTLTKVLNYKIKNDFTEKYLMPKLKIKFKGEVSYIPQREIVYIEKTGKKVIIFTRNHSYEYTTNLKDLENILNKNLFIRCHSGFIVNIDYITAYKKSNIYLINNLCVPVSKSNINKVMEILEKKLWECEL